MTDKKDISNFEENNTEPAWLDDKQNDDKEGFVPVDPKHEVLVQKRPFWTKKKKIVLGVIIAVLCALSVAGAFLWSFLNTSFSDDDEDIKAELATTNFDEPFYMLLIGTDTREGDTYKLEDGRSDTCILVRIDPITFVVSMISIPRDTKITVNGSTEKFNAAYAYGGVSATIAQVKKLTGVEISHYAEISFNGLTDMVDAVGGVEIDVPEEINDVHTDAYVPAGHQTLNGIQALSFARSRNFADGDFTRTADQRVLIDALINKAFKMDIADLPNVLRAAKNFVKTDLRLGDMLGLATQFKDADQLTVYSAMIPSINAGEGGISYVATDKAALKRMLKLIENSENPLYTEVDSGAQICSSRDAAELAELQAKHFKEHPDCPGRISNSNSYNSSSNYDDNNSSYYEYNTNEYY